MRSLGWAVLFEYVRAITQNEMTEIYLFSFEIIQQIFRIAHRQLQRTHDSITE